MPRRECGLEIESSRIRIDIQKLERNYKRLQSLRLKPEGAVGGA